MKLHTLTIAGFGGQGVMLLGQMIAYAGNYDGLNSLWYPSYGPETRGGTANCSVTVSDEIIYSPIFANSTCLIAFNRPSLDKFKNKVAPGGIILYNSSVIDQVDPIEGITMYPIPVNDIANDLGNLKVINMVMLGAFLELTHLYCDETIYTVLKKILGEKKQDLLEVNQKAILAGRHTIQK